MRCLTFDPWFNDHDSSDLAGQDPEAIRFDRLAEPTGARRTVPLHDRLLLQPSLSIRSTRCLKCSADNGLGLFLDTF